MEQRTTVRVRAFPKDQLIELLRKKKVGTLTRLENVFGFHTTEDRKVHLVTFKDNDEGTCWRYAMVKGANDPLEEWGHEVLCSEVEA